MNSLDLAPSTEPSDSKRARSSISARRRRHSSRRIGSRAWVASYPRRSPPEGPLSCRGRAVAAPLVVQGLPYVGPEGVYRNAARCPDLDAPQLARIDQLVHDWPAEMQTLARFVNCQQQPFIGVSGHGAEVNTYRSPDALTVVFRTLDDLQFCYRSW